MSKQNSPLGIFRSSSKLKKIANEVGEKEYIYRSANFESLHSKINTLELSKRERNRASKDLKKFQNKYYKKQISKLKKDMPDHEFNYDSKGRIIGISKKGETNMNMFFSLDPDLRGVYDSNGKLVAKRGL